MAENDDTRKREVLPPLNKKEILDIAVAVLGITQSLKELGGMNDPSLPRPPALSGLLFDLASLQVRAAGELAQIGTSQATQLLEFARARRAGARPCTIPGAEALPRVLVNLKGKRGAVLTGNLTLRKTTKKPREYTFPEVLEFERIDEATGKGTGALDFVNASFAPGPCVPVTPEKDVVVTLTITSATSADLPKGRLRARVVIDADGVPALELIVELKLAP